MRDRREPLARYDAACRALAEAKDVDELLAIRDAGTALRGLARIARNRGLEADAAELRVRAERRLGEMIAAQRDAGHMAIGGRPKTGLSDNPVSPPGSPPTLADVGIDKNLAHAARRAAAIAADEFEVRLNGFRNVILSGAGRASFALVVDKVTRRNLREAELATKVRALPDARFGVILDDPEWRFEVRSRETGLDRAADNHYPTSDLAAIVARSEQIAATIAAPDCAWFRWVTVPFLAHGIRALEVGGFVYKSSWAWGKNRQGTGFWNRNRHELLLLAVRGDVPCPSPGEQWGSLIEAPVGVHSAKPEIFLEMIEQYFPNVPKIELNRRGPARPGWAAWGNEAEQLEEVA